MRGRLTLGDGVGEEFRERVAGSPRPIAHAREIQYQTWPARNGRKNS